MNYFSLSNHELHSKTLAAAATEKQATLALLEYLQEVDRRKLYAERGFPGLWMYVHKELGYSEAQTSERVGAMRLMTRMPEVKESIAANKLTLTAAAKLATHVRREKTGREKTLELLAQVEEKPTREVEKLLLAEQRVPNARPDYTRATGPETSRISFDADAEFMEMLTQMRELQSDPTLQLQDLFKKAMKEYVDKRKLKSRAQHTASRAAEVRRENTADTSAPSHPTSRHIPAVVKALVRARSGDQCEYVAKTTSGSSGKIVKKRCEMRGQLQFDHITPFALGGNHSPANIRHLCREHNLYVAIKIFGAEKMNAQKINAQKARMG